MADWFVGGLAQVLVGVGERVSWGVGARARGLVTLVAWMGCMARVGYTGHVHAVLDALSLSGRPLGFPWSGQLSGFLGVRRSGWGKEGANERGLSWRWKVEVAVGGQSINHSQSIEMNARFIVCEVN